jgi:transcription initiation factor TFIIIB Brf1 subunit/transcription initiation factor TFIIB
MNPIKNNLQCPTCGSTDIDYDGTRGEYVCSCGRVLQENAVVSELTFNSNQEVKGKFGSQSGDYSQIKNLLGYSQNRELRRAKAYRQIE